jgi:hypothetical protein
MLQNGLFRTRQLKSAECSRRAPNGGYRIDRAQAL